MVDPIPAGLDHRVIPYLMIDGASDAIAFYVDAFGAVEEGRLTMPDGSIGHGGDGGRRRRHDRANVTFDRLISGW